MKMSSLYQLLCNTLLGLVASCKPATRNILEEVASYYTVIPGSDFDLDIVLTKVPKEKPILDCGLAAGVTATIVGTCCVAAASVGLYAYKKYGNLRKVLKDLDNQKNDSDAENRKLQEMLEERDRMLQEAERGKNKLEEEYEEDVWKLNDRINELEMEKEDTNEELVSALRHGKEMEALLEDARARELEMKSSLLSLEERLQQKDCQIEDLLSNERKLKSEKQQLAKKIERDEKQMESLLAELKETEYEVGLCFNIIEEKEKNLKDHFEGEIKKKDDVIASLQNKLENALHQKKEMETLMEEARAREAEMKSTLRSEEEKLEQRDRQLEELLSVERRREVESEQLNEKLKKQEKVIESLLERANGLQNELENCFRLLDESKDCKLYLEGEIQKKNKVIESLQNKLEDALQREKEIESLLVEAKQNERKINVFKEQLENRNSQVKELLLEVERFKGENQAMEQKLANALREAGLEQQLLRKQAEEHVEISLYWQQKFEEANKEVETLKHREEDLAKKLKDCEAEVKKANNKIREILNNEDKYMLMALLHGIAERNFHLEHIAFEYGNENQQKNTEEEKDEDLLDQMQRRKVEQYNRAQQERNNYAMQWGDLTQMLEALMCGDESLPELTNVVSGQNSDIETHRCGVVFLNTDDETPDQGHDDRHTRNEIQILQRQYDEVSRQLKEAKDRLQEAEEKAQELQGKLREAEYKLTQKSTQMETLDRRAVLKSRADRCIDDQDFDSALALLKVIIKQYGNELECRVKEVRCLLTLARTDEAEDVLNDLPKEFKESFVIKIESALLSACNLEFGKSRKLLSQVLDICPNHPRALIAEKFVEQRMLWEALPGMIDAPRTMRLPCKILLWGHVFGMSLSLGRHTDAITEFAKLEEDEKGEYLVSLAEDLEKMQQYGCPYKVLEWLDDDEDDESESDCDFEYNSDSDDESESDSEDDSDESESDSEDDSDDEANLTLMECSHSDHLDNESSVGQLEEEDDDSYEELDDEEDEDEDDAREDIPNKEWLEESDEEDDEFDADDEDDEDDDGWEDIPYEGCLEESSEEGDEIDSTSGEESQDECDSDSVEESDDDSDDE
ncbi:plectin-like [Macrobrachium nipponense]|uniref:plectin-like n=1 Tax=Macrobrachium nipponense TaxID=159736 RepID=UPI0030C89890